MRFVQDAYASKMGRLGFVAGLIQQQKMESFERILFRATRGNVFFKSSPVGRLRDPSSGEQLDKCAFVVFFAGDRSKTKIMKVSGKLCCRIPAAICPDWAWAVINYFPFLGCP